MIERDTHITIITTCTWFALYNYLSVMGLSRTVVPHKMGLTQLLKKVFAHSQIIETYSTVYCFKSYHFGVSKYSTKLPSKFVFDGHLDVIKKQTQPKQN